MTGLKVATKSRDWQDRALAHLWPHSEDIEWDELNANGGLPVFESGSGSTLTDVDGNSYIDGLSGLFVVNVGHGRTEIAQAMADQAARLAYAAPSGGASTASVALVEQLADVTPDGLDRIFLCSGGSEAVETALKIAKQAQVLRGYPKRTKVICRRGSFHGTTGGVMALTQSASEKYFGPFQPGVRKAASPNHYRPVFGQEGEMEDLLCAAAVEQAILAAGPEYVAAFIAEPISVSNGVHIPSVAYWQRIREICDRHGVLLILDEVLTGFGRTGAMFAAENFGIFPDLMTMSKGLSSGYAPTAGVAVTDSVFEPFKQDGNGINHILTFGGNAVAAVAGRRNIEILLEEDLPARSAELGTLFHETARGLLDHPTVGDVRGGLGLLGGVELVKSKESKESWGAYHPFIKSVDRGMRERGLITRVWDVMQLGPPLVISREEIQRMFEIIDSALTNAEREFESEIG